MGAARREGRVNLWLLQSEVAAYAGVAFLGHMVMLAPNYFSVTIRFAGEETQSGAAAFVASVGPFASFAVLFILARLSLVLPAMALGAAMLRSARPGRSAKQTRGGCFGLRFYASCRCW
jgi:hypothetical protein